MNLGDKYGKTQKSGSWSKFKLHNIIAPLKMGYSL